MKLFLIQKLINKIKVKFTTKKSETKMYKCFIKQNICKVFICFIMEIKFNTFLTSISPNFNLTCDILNPFNQSHQF